MERKNTWKNVDGASEKNNEGAQPAKQKFYLIRYIYVTILGHSVGLRVYRCIAWRCPEYQRLTQHRLSEVVDGQPSMADQCWERIGEDNTSRILFQRGPIASVGQKERRDEQ